MAYSMPDKDSGATLDYKFDFRALTNQGGSNTELTDWLEVGETITSFSASATAVTSGCVPNIVDSYLANDASSIVVWLSGGDLHREFYLNVKFTTSSSPVNRKDERTMKIKILDR